MLIVNALVLTASAATVCSRLAVVERESMLPSWLCLAAAPKPEATMGHPYIRAGRTEQEEIAHNVKSF